MSWVPRIGAEFADYRLDALLGHGGMSIVYRAEHVRLGRKVALKLLSPQLSEDEGFRDRFTRESRLAAALDHPNIIPIYEANEAEGVFFIAMRYVEGADLRALIRRESPLQLERTISIINQTANALAAAHDKGLIHRDVKPANILIDAGAGHDGLDHAYLSDFGVAKQTSAPGFTKTGIFVGTADYASPEQIEGKELDGRADVYSLGCVIYECLTGSSAYDKDSEVALMYAHLLEAPPSVTEKRPDLPAEIDEVVAKAMAKSRDERYQTPKEAASELRRVLSDVAAGSAAAAAGGRETVLAGATVSGGDEGSGTTASTPKPGETVVSGGGPQQPARAAAPDAPNEPGRARRSPLVALAAAGALAAIGLIVAVLALAGGDDDGEPQGAGQTGGQTATGGEPAATPASLIEVLVPTQIARTCTSSTTAREGALETHVCTAAEGASVSDPNEVELSFFADGQSLEQAYAAAKEGVKPVSCTAATGERLWTHPTTGNRGGRRLCFVDQSDFVIVWTHEKLGSPDHVDTLGIAREPGRSPTMFRTWWNALNDSLGKCRPQVAEDACFGAIQQLTS